MTSPTVYEVGTNYTPAPEALRVYNAAFRRIKEFAPDSILEIGCGTGILAKKIMAIGCRYVGIEPNPAQHERARRNLPDLKILPHSCYEDPVTLNLGKFDLVYSGDVIEHLYQPRKLVSFAKAHMTNGGAIITVTPDYGNYFRNLALSLANRWDAHHTPLWDGGHIKFFSRRTLRQLLEEQGFNHFKWWSVRSRRAPIFPMNMICMSRIR